MEFFEQRRMWVHLVAAFDLDGSIAAVRLLGPGTARAVTTDATGAIYVAGSFGLRRLNSDLTAVYDRAFGTEGFYDVAVDDQGRAHAVGNTDVGIVRVAAGGTAIEYQNNTLGGIAYGVDLDPDGTAYATGAGGVTAIDSQGDIVWTTTLGGVGSVIAADDENLYIAGETTSPGQATPGAFDTSLDGVSDGFVVVLNTVDGTLGYWTYLGGNADDAVVDVAIDQFGAVHVVGSTRSGDFPVTDDGAIRQLQGVGDAFVAKLTPLGYGAADLLYATFLGGSDPGLTDVAGTTVELPYLMPDRAFGVALGPQARTLVVGETGASNLPIVGPTDELGFTDALLAGLVIPNRLPVADAGADRDALVGETLIFDGSGSVDADGVIVSHGWDYGDGTTASGRITTHTYTQGGTFVATLTVTDDRGGTATDAVTVTVKTAIEAIQEAIETIETMDLPGGTERSLIAKLDAAGRALTRGQTPAAIGQLEAFLNEVDALNTSKLTPTQAVELTAAVERITGPTKTHQSRSVALPGFLRDLLAEHIAGRADDLDAYVFVAPEGGQLRHQTFMARFFRPAVRAAGLDGLRFHDLRHTCAALLIAQGAHPRAIADRLGHSTVSVTMDVYGHLLPSLDEALTDGLDRTWSENHAASSRPTGDIVDFRTTRTG